MFRINRKLGYTYAAICLALPITVFTLIAQTNNTIQFIAVFLTMIVIGFGYCLLHFESLVFNKKYRTIKTFRALWAYSDTRKAFLPVLLLLLVGIGFISVGFAFRNRLFWTFMLIGSGTIYYAHHLFDTKFQLYSMSMWNRIISINDPKPKLALVEKGTEGFPFTFYELYPSAHLEQSIKNGAVLLSQDLPTLFKAQFPNIGHLGILAGLSALAGHAWQAHLRQHSDDFSQDMEQLKSQQGYTFYFGSNLTAGVVGAHESMSIGEILEARIEKICSCENIDLDLYKLQEYVKQSRNMDKYGLPRPLQMTTEPNPLLLLKNNWEHVLSELNKSIAETHYQNSYVWHILLTWVIDEFIQQHMVAETVDGTRILQIAMESAIAASHIDLETIHFDA